MDAPEYTTRAAFETLRGDRGLAWDGEGLWALGSLTGLLRPMRRDRRNTRGNALREASGARVRA